MVWGAGVWAPGLWADGVWAGASGSSVWANGVWGECVWASDVWAGLQCDHATPPSDFNPGKGGGRSKRKKVVYQGRVYEIPYGAEQAFIGSILAAKPVPRLRARKESKVVPAEVPDYAPIVVPQYAELREEFRQDEELLAHLQAVTARYLEQIGAAEVARRLADEDDVETILLAI